MVRIKFCGMKRREDALAAARLGVDALGFIFAEESPRYIKPSEAKEIISELAPFILRVGVFLNQDIGDILKIVSLCRLDAVQLHGDESPSFCRELKKNIRVIKALRVGDKRVLDTIPEYGFVDAVLLDTYSAESKGGTGQTFNWEIAEEARKFGLPIILSGGLNPENVKTALQKVNPYALDVSSGIEKEIGVKDQELMAKFIAAAWEEEWGL